MSRPRTPEHFPRMKVRGGRRRLHARIEQAWRGVREPIENLRQAFVRIEVDVRAFADAMTRMARQVRVSIWLTQKRAHDRWVARHALPATPSPWAAPTRTEAH